MILIIIIIMILIMLIMIMIYDSGLSISRFNLILYSFLDKNHNFRS